MSWDVEGDALVLRDYAAADGWDAVVEEEDDDELSSTLRAPAGEDGERRVEVEVEFNGAVELDIDYRVMGPLPG